MRDGLTLLLRQVLRNTPGSLSAIAKAAHVPRATLARIAAGEREASPAIVAAVADALTGWSQKLRRHVRRLRASRERRAS